ncbi:hypothetical protein [uncultured Methanobrevibacter sp.]|uniref:hypothetical protein n=1 Tax=uncultured Methanobrevibacter sp. TaxID=253161 RepID=UPI002626B0A7|nr:hypothetical protein [uncultured Methanobrevibacter sp.]
MKMQSKILVVFLILAFLLSVAGVSASEINDTSLSMAEDSQNDTVLESSDSEEVLNAADDNSSDPVLSMEVSGNFNTTVVVNSSSKDVKSSVAMSGQVLKSSYGKLKKVTLKSKYNKYVTKKVGKYKIQVYKWKGYMLGGLNIYLTKYGKYVKSSAFLTRAYFKMNGKWRWSSWSHASSGYTFYHHYAVSNGVKITKVQVKFRYR